MRVAGEILQNLFGAAEWRFGIDNPLDPFGLAAQGVKCSRIGQRGHLPMKLKLAFSKRFSQISQKLVPEETAQYPDRKKERFRATNPTCAVRADAAARHDAVEMGMQMKVLSPGVKNGQKANRRAQVFGIGRDREQ